MNKQAFLLLFLLWTTGISSQVSFIRDNGQHSFRSFVAAGNYSGITWLGGSKYAVVCDKSHEDGFYLFDIDIDSVTGVIKNVERMAFLSNGGGNRDAEGIVYHPSTNTVFISGEADNAVYEYDMGGMRTGRMLRIPDIYMNIADNYGLESLAYNEHTGLFWTVNESTLKTDGIQADSQNKVCNVLRIQSFNEHLEPVSQYFYKTDAPLANARSRFYAMGVSEITALDNGSLLVLEREFFVPSVKIGAFVNCKIYEINPSEAIPADGSMPIAADMPFIDKRLVYQWRTSLGLFNRSIANYEGMCQGPELPDGSRVLVLVSDSQNQYAGVLRDWFKTIIIKMSDTKNVPLFP